KLASNVQRKFAAAAGAVVAQSLRTLSSSADHADKIEALKTLNSFLDDAAESGATSAAEREEFRRAHYSRTLRVGVGLLQADWMSAAQRSQLVEPLFLKGPPDQALLALMEAVSQLSPSAGLDRLVSVTESFLQSGRLADLLWSSCLQSGLPGSPQLDEALLARLTALPDITANKLRLGNRPLFAPQRYYPLLASEMLAALERTCQALRDGTDCSVAFVAQTLGKVCVQGHSGPVLAVMAPRLAVCTRSDALWQRVCWKLLQNVPERWLEGVLTGLVQAVKSPEAFSRIVGNLALTNKKAQFVLTHKVLLLQYSYETQVLRTVLGHLASDRERRPLLVQVCAARQAFWCSERCTAKTDCNLKISYIFLKLVYLIRLSLVLFTIDLLIKQTSIMTVLPRPGQVSRYFSRFPINSFCPANRILRLFCCRPSDDDLTPYDMSGDQETGQASPPRYLRDCLETLMSSEDSERVELSLRVAESLVRRNVFAAKEISVQMTKVLLHMEDKYSISGFLALRQAAMVALAVTDSVPVTQYLTAEFYSLNYSLRQRLDILEVLALAAQELSTPFADKTSPSAAAPELTSYPATDPAHWRQVVEKRIQSKTRRISKGSTHRGTKAAPNRYAPAAGYFFFPLLRNYDKPEVTFDLLGSDHLVLGRLIHTLGLFMHLAVNAPVLFMHLFLFCLMVRRGVLFAVCAVFLSMPSQSLLVDLGEQLFETRTWLSGKNQIKCITTEEEKKNTIFTKN
uniref:Telomere length regulation protein TEL2 homolog n=1 Tax=Fundulus heteroclitus TaxID=8078 RepID=A0A3Q2Q6N2_FUNHE